MERLPTAPAASSRDVRTRACPRRGPPALRAARPRSTQWPTPGTPGRPGSGRWRRGPGHESDGLVRRSRSAARCARQAARKVALGFGQAPSRGPCAHRSASASILVAQAAGRRAGRIRIPLLRPALQRAEAFAKPGGVVSRTGSIRRSWASSYQVTPRRRSARTRWASASSLMRSLARPWLRSGPCSTWPRMPCSVIRWSLNQSRMARSRAPPVAAERWPQPARRSSRPAPNPRHPWPATSLLGDAPEPGARLAHSRWQTTWSCTGSTCGPSCSLGRPVRLLHQHRAQVVDKLARRAVGERGARPRGPAPGWPDARPPRPSRSSRNGCASRVGHQAQVGVQAGQVVLAHGEQRPHAPVAQGRAELVEERLLGGAVGRDRGQDLLELVEDQHLGVGRSRRPTAGRGTRAGPARLGPQAAVGWSAGNPSSSASSALRT